MAHADLAAFLRADRAALRRGPVALIFDEDGVELVSTLRHHRDLGFGTMLCLGRTARPLPDDLAGRVIWVGHDMTGTDAVPAAVNRLIDAAPGIWMFYCFNAEYLVFPFCETRRVGEMLAFHAEERRSAMLTYVVDVYARDLDAAPDAVSREDAWLDRAGYFAQARPDPATGFPRERQLDFFGGLRWRFEEHVPADRRRIDRIALFRAKRGLRLLPDHRFSDEEYNTYACKWHNNLTAALLSFRTAKALRRNPGSRAAIGTFHWFNAARCDWTSRQLLDLGLIEPGQWF